MGKSSEYGLRYSEPGFVAAMSTACLTSSYSSYLFCKTTRTTTLDSLPSSQVHFRSRKLSSCFLCSPSHFYQSVASSLLSSTNKTRVFTVLAVVEEEPVTAVTSEEETNCENGSPQLKDPSRLCEIYVCNLPRSCGISELLEMFKSYGTVQSVEVSRNAETGISRGCGYVTMTSINEAKAAIAALDGSDVGGREMRVSFSADMDSRRRNSEALNSAPNKNFIFESVHKLYVGNLAWSVKPDDLRNHFSQFGTVVSARVLHDRKAGKNRIYGFLSFNSAAECEAAISLDGTELHGRTLLVREALERSQP